MAKLPDIRRVLREDMKDAPDWVTQIISPLNSLMESTYQSLNKQLTFSENINSSTRTMEFSTTSTYPSKFTPIQVQSGIKGKVTGVFICQLVEKGGNYSPILDSPFLNWNEINGQVNIFHITGLQPSKTYNLTILII